MEGEFNDLNREYLVLKKEFLLFLLNIELTCPNQSKISPKAVTKKRHFENKDVIKYANQFLRFAQECVKKTTASHAKKLVYKIINQEILNLTTQIQKMIRVNASNIYDEIHRVLVASHTKIEKKVSLIANNKEYLEKQLISRTMSSIQLPLIAADNPKPKFKL